MYRDAQDFIDLLNSLDHHPYAPARELFLTQPHLIVTRAPGRDGGNRGLLRLTRSRISHILAVAVELLLCSAISHPTPRSKASLKVIRKRQATSPMSSAAHPPAVSRLVIESSN